MIVTLYLLAAAESITEAQILETFQKSGVSDIFEQLSESEKRKILNDILAQKTDNQQIKTTMKYIDRLGL